MPALRENDYDAMATRVVDRFMNGEKLADMAVNEAMGGQLNPDQIERLVQAVNVMAFLRMMEGQKAQGSPDLTHEFDPVETRDVLTRIVDQTPFGHDMDLMSGHGGPPPGGPPHAEPDGDELPDEMAAHRAPPGEGEALMASGDDGGPKSPPIDADNDGPFPKGDKQKAKEDSSKKDEKDGPAKSKKEPPKAPEKDEQKEAAIRQRRLRKLADLLDDQFLQAELAFEEGYERLSRQFKFAHGAPAYEVFEKDALAVDGAESGALVLNLLRAERGLPALAANDALEKHAALVDRHLVSDSAELQLFERLTKIAAEAARVQRGAETLRAQCD